MKFALQKAYSFDSTTVIQLQGGKHSMSNRKEKKEENREGTQTSKHPNGYPKLEVFEKAATKKDDHNHRNSLQR